MKKILLLTLAIALIGCKEKEVENTDTKVRFGEDLGASRLLEADEEESVAIICSSLKRYSDYLDNVSDGEINYKFRLSEKVCDSSEEVLVGSDFFADLKVPMSGTPYYKEKTATVGFESSIITHESDVIDRVCDDYFGAEEIYNQYDEGDVIFKYTFNKLRNNGVTYGASFRVGLYKKNDGNWSAKSIEQFHVLESTTDKYDGVVKDRYIPSSCSNGESAYKRQYLVK